MVDISLPQELEPFRSRFIASVKPYIEIQPQLVRQATPWQSRIAGFPYLPKGFDYPTTPEGDFLHLLAQINFEEVPHLDGFPEKGILEFFIARDGAYGLLEFDKPTKQSNFRVLYFPEPNFDEDSLITNFDFLPTIWDYDNEFFPFWTFPSVYRPHRDECFSLRFNLKSAPMSICDYQFQQIIGSEVWNILLNNQDNFESDYQNDFAVGHKIGGYPHFTQSDPRVLLSTKEPYILLFQIDSDDTASDKIHIQWGDIGVGNFFIPETDLKQLDFSRVLYNWDCC